MAQEWYLMKSPYDQLSGFEDEAFDDFAEGGFLEALDSELADDVEICNCDLSECTSARAIITDTLQSTALKTLNRGILLPIGSCHAGLYIKYKDRYWLIKNVVDDNHVYEKGIMAICNHLLTWENDDGKIIQRWANVTNASQYNNGETGTDNYNVRDDKLMVLTPGDDESILMKVRQRFIIDRKCEVYEKHFADTVEKETSKIVNVYELTRSDTVLYDYQDSGYFQFMASQVEQGVNDGYYKINGKGYWLGRKVPSTKDDNDNQTSVLSCAIVSDSDTIYAELEAGVFEAKFYDADGKEIQAEPTWEIICDFKDSLDIEYADNSILIYANDETLVNKTFELKLRADGYETATKTITIEAFI